MGYLEAEFDITIKKAKRNASDYSDPISVSYLNTWHEIPNLFSNITIPSQYGKINVNIEWKELKSFIEFEINHELTLQKSSPY